jgi:ComF family protein
MTSSEYQCFCFLCRRHLRETNLHLTAENAITERLWGRLPLRAGAAMYYFQKKAPIQRALHQLKYGNQPEVGILIGRLYGRLLAQSPVFASLEGIVPVPLHPLKLRQRGYNQSAVFAQGLSETLRVPVLADALVRGVYATSQTRKHRIERYENVETAFGVHNPKRLEGRHLLLVDDVLTTGATLESCGAPLARVDGVQLSLATIAIAVKEHEMHSI